MAVFLTQSQQVALPTRSPHAGASMLEGPWDAEGDQSVNGRTDKARLRKWWHAQERGELRRSSGARGLERTQGGMGSVGNRQRF